MGRSSIKPPTDCDFWCTTKGSMEANFKTVWTIERFSQRPEKNKESLDSDTFNIQGPGSMKTQWKILLYPKGAGPEVSDWLSVYLHNERPRICLSQAHLIH